MPKDYRSTVPSGVKNIGAQQVARTVLEYLRSLDGLSPERAAARLGMTEVRLDMLESGIGSPTQAEIAKLEKTFRADVDTLLAAPTEANRAKVLGGAL